MKMKFRSKFKIYYLSFTSARVKRGNYQCFIGSYSLQKSQLVEPMLPMRKNKKCGI